ncbi:MAG: hypothetical protein AB1679_28330 [Actinomycetota bacterium]|jgi:hypothetical protein
MTDDTTRPSGRRHTSRRDRRAASRLRRVEFAAGGLAALVAAGLLVGGLTGGDLPGISLVLGEKGSAAQGGSSSTTSSTTAETAAGAIGSGAGAGGLNSSTDRDSGAGTAGGGGTNGVGVPPSAPLDPSKPTQPSTPANPGTPTSPTSPTTPGDPAPSRALPDAEKLAAAAITAGDLGGGWKQIAAGTHGIGFACDAGRTVTGDTSATRALRRPGVTVTNHNFGYHGTGAADTFAAYRAAAVGCGGWKISEYARSLDIAVTVTQDSPSHLVLSYEIKDRGHPTTYQVEHVLLAGNTLGIVSMETAAPPAKELLATLTGGVDAVAARLAALGV